MAVEADVRGFGVLAGIEIWPGKTLGAHGAELQEKLFERGLRLNTTGNAAIIAPSFVSGHAAADLFAATLRDALADY
jgi:beta-alanine--pyruvate transaminase